MNKCEGFVSKLLTNEILLNTIVCFCFAYNKCFIETKVNIGFFFLYMSCFAPHKKNMGKIIHLATLTQSVEHFV